MRKQLLFFACMLTAMAASAQTVDNRNFGIDGFAAYAGTPGTNHYLEGGTTGGEGGKVVKADNFTQLQAYLQSTKPYIILVDHDITPGIKCYVDATSTGKLCDKQDGTEGVETTYGERIMVASNKTLIGIANAETGKAPLFSRITFVMQCVSNVIIRNCRFTMNGVPVLKNGENKIVAWRNGTQKEVGDPDCIGIQADNTSAKTDWGAHIWIDHCEFFNGDAANKDRYDGLLDCKNNVQWLTFSYNLFHDHEKACLFGKGNSDVFDNCRTISFHHNYFKDIVGSRLPLQRGGYLHYMNNYQENSEDGWDVRSAAIGYADACYFKDAKAAIRLRGEGKININQAEGYDIIYHNCDRIIEGYADKDISGREKHAEYYSYANNQTDWLPTDTWANYFVNNHDKSADVPAICEKYSGAGKIVVWNEEVPAFNINDFAEAVDSQRAMGDTAVYDENGNKVTKVDTGIQEVGTTTSSVKNGKYLKNGKLVIEKDGKQFNAAGVAND